MSPISLPTVRVPVPAFRVRAYPPSIVLGISTSPVPDPLLMLVVPVKERGLAKEIVLFTVVRVPESNTGSTELVVSVKVPEIEVEDPAFNVNWPE